MKKWGFMVSVSVIITTFAPPFATAFNLIQVTDKEYVARTAHINNNHRVVSSEMKGTDGEVGSRHAPTPSLNQGTKSDNVLRVISTGYTAARQGKNFHRFLELFFNSVGRERDTERLTDGNIASGLERQEFFTLGRAHISGDVKLELHPVLNTLVSAFHTVTNPAGVLEPNAAPDVVRHSHLTVECKISYEGRGAGLPGSEIPDTTFPKIAPDSAFLWLKYHF